jgi:DNA-directed RNA polymerase I, II, and III subunit RPABC1
MSQEQAFKICMEMLQYRGYEIVDTDTDSLTITAIKPDGHQMVVYFNNAPKFDTKSMKEIISYMNEMEILHALVIYKDSITAATKNVLTQLDDMRIELFAEKDLQVNITKHRLQPIFERLESKEAEEFKKLYGVKFGTLRTDKPIARFYDYRRGDVIRVIRPGGYITYRIVK